MTTPDSNAFDLCPKIALSKAAELLNISIQGLHRKIKSKGLVCPKIGNKSFLTHAISRELLDIDFHKQCITTQIVKGGVGKTTSVHNIGCCANAYGARVLLIDIDPQGNLTDAFGIDPEETPVLIDLLENPDIPTKDSIITICEGLDLLPSRIENVVVDNTIVNKKLPLDRLFKNLLRSVIHRYDFIFIDCPPTMGQLVTSASLFADTILAPLNPEKFSAKGLKILKEEIHLLEEQYDGRTINFKVFLNKFSANTILSDKAIATLIADPDMEGRTLDTAVRIAQEIPNTTDDNRNLFSSVKKSTARDDFDQLTRELLGIKLISKKSSSIKETALEV